MLKICSIYTAVKDIYIYIALIAQTMKGKLTLYEDLVKTTVSVLTRTKYPYPQQCHRRHRNIAYACGSVNVFTNVNDRPRCKQQKWWRTEQSIFMRLFDHDSRDSMENEIALFICATANLDSD